MALLSGYLPVIHRLMMNLILLRLTVFYPSQECLAIKHWLNMGEVLTLKILVIMFSNSVECHSEISPTIIEKPCPLGE